ncbi:signal recognition particle-docking protein FtsY [Pseudaminobacter soli (ex Li et al. 2025)]|uniref:Signal recognition particle receptor FtsY n=1 Tax=Pseudaminobacter soli (ex Li et al. 2025) TaxID=1295366 RepID=A0A2P7SHX2_9HYPH|nr:signal recognition particle-docking protein FtsY [Mesorhizobium soli]PSJ62067.1 signal recognition particle-docking protein FtsY [Mesorhizobium soli]
MAFGFIKKVFSFGKKPAEEAAPETEAPVTPVLEQQAHETEAPAASPVSEESIEAVDRVAEASSAVEAADVTEASVVAQAPATVEPIPSGPADHLPLAKEQEPSPQEPTPLPDEPAPAPTPAEPTPAPSEVPPEVPSEVPEEPAEQPEELPVEIPEPTPGPGEPTSETAEPIVAPPAPAREPAIELPVAEVLPPLRQPSPVEVDPLRDEVAPEITPIETIAEAETAAPAKEASHSAPVAVAETAATPVPSTPLAPAPAGKVTVSKKVEQKAEPVAPTAPAPRLTWFQRLRQGLSRSSKELSGSIAGVFTKRKLDEDTLQELEDVLIRADLGMETAIRITDALSSSRYGKDVSDTEVRAVMAEQVEKVLKPVAMPLELDLSHKPHVILVVGVNGTGKTTTIGKLAAKLTEGGLSVMLAAGDTFRAAAIEQLKIWGERTGSPVVSSKLGADAAGLAYDAFEKAKAAGSDVLIIDTAGRLQNKAELMAELEKIVRVLGKLDPEAPHTVLQTVDATTGQNALNQVEIFRNVAGVNGLVMTKLDGTARGGILVAIAAKHRLPVYFIGVGEQVDDLEPFSAGDFAKAIAGVA